MHKSTSSPSLSIRMQVLSICKHSVITKINVQLDVIIQKKRGSFENRLKGVNYKIKFCCIPSWFRKINIEIKVMKCV